MNICLFSEQEINSPLDFADERAEHIIKILHKKEGETFTAGIIGGQSGVALITKIDEAARQIFFDFTATGDGKPLNPLKMIVGFPRPIQLRRLLRDVAALGVCELHLTGTELGEKSYMQSDLAKPEKVRELLLEGTVQAGSTHVPEVFVHKSLKECLESLRSLSFDKLRNRRAEGQTLICLDNVNPACSLAQAVVPELVEGPCDIVAAIGSERGWTDKERALLEEVGFIRCGMGPRIMRTETAATVAGAIILNAMGVLN
ncbi:MAG: RsmE family RNA methyltransferase [Treponema sp.]|nr:RsmE family RNA methyltransferase [Treponema sp.]